MTDLAAASFAMMLHLDTTLVTNENEMEFYFPDSPF
jgi:hypothetical protein